jgi:hypothetical protein
MESKIASGVHAARQGATDEERRLAARVALVDQHHFRTLLNTMQTGVFVATKMGCVAGRGSADSYELLRSDWGHTTFDTGPYHVEHGEGGTYVGHYEEKALESAFGLELGLALRVN